MTGALSAVADKDEPFVHRDKLTAAGCVSGRKRPIINYSGGTDVGGEILGRIPVPARGPAAFNSAQRGVDAAVFDDDGEAVGAVGELLVRNISPRMTHTFWQETARYLDTSGAAGTGLAAWRPASVDEQGMWLIHGRADDTIKLSGRRVGPAEIEAALLHDPRIAEVAVIGVPDERRG